MQLSVEAWRRRILLRADNYMWCTKVIHCLLFCGFSGSGSLSNPVTIKAEQHQLTQLHRFLNRGRPGFLCTSLRWAIETYPGDEHSPTHRLWATCCLRDGLTFLMAQWISKLKQKLTWREPHNGLKEVCWALSKRSLEAAATYHRIFLHANKKRSTYQENNTPSAA